jgi:hypothetical protein
MKVAPEITRVVSPVFVKVMVWGIEVVPSSRAANVSDVWDKDTDPTPPVPCTEISDPAPVTTSVASNIVCCVPVAVGLKVTLTWQGV